MIKEVLKKEFKQECENKDFYLTIKNREKYTPDPKLSLFQKIKIGLHPLKNPYSPFIYPIRKKTNYYYNYRLLNDIDLAKSFKDFYFSKVNIKSKDINILDFGCGQGRTIAILNQLGFENIVGQDILHFEYWKKLKSSFLKIPLGYKDFYPYQEDSFDIAFSFQVHMYLNDELLQNHINNIAKILKNGGYFIFEDRNENMLNPEIYLKNKDCPFIHKRNRVLQLLEKNDLKVIEEKTYGITSKHFNNFNQIAQSLIVKKEKFDIFSYRNKSWFDSYLSKKIPKGREPLHLFVCQKK